MSILFDEAQPVDGFANFLENVAADTVQAVSMNEGGPIHCQIRRGRKLKDLFAKAESVAV